VPLWAWIALAGGVLLLAAAAVIIATLAWRSYERRALLRLLVRAEAVEAAERALRELVERLAGQSEAELEAFAYEGDSLDRKALAEVRGRANILADELDRMALPGRLVPVAEALADAAYTICEQASVVRDDDRGQDALDRLAAIDLGRVRSYAHKARTLLTGACTVCGLDETAVYGGGLYL
jgi:hypothetical protein